MEALTTSADTMKRWGFAQGAGPLVGAIFAETPVPNALLLALDGSMSADEAAAEAQAALEEIAGALE
jgi:multiple sugar transport system substrate-binding protein